MDRAVLYKINVIEIDIYLKELINENVPTYINNTKRKNKRNTKSRQFIISARVEARVVVVCSDYL